MIIHPNYIHEYLRNDIAVIKINPSSNFFQSPNIGAVELPVNYTSELFVGTKGRVVRIHLFKNLNLLLFIKFSNSLSVSRGNFLYFLVWIR